MDKNQEIMQGYDLLSKIKNSSGKERAADLAALQKLYHKNKKTAELQSAYAEALYACSEAQEGMEREASVQTIARLWEKHAKNPLVLSMYAQALAAYSQMLDLQGKRQSVERLRMLYQEHPQSESLSAALEIGRAHV